MLRRASCNVTTQSSTLPAANRPGALFTEMMCECYPGATIIHLLRDPRDGVASLFRMPWAPRNVFGNAHVWLRHNLTAPRSQHRPTQPLVRYERPVTRPA